MTNIVKNQRECRLISITNGDNVYGSDVVASVRRHPAADMLLAPLDSRTFAEHGECHCSTPPLLSAQTTLCLK